MIKNFEEYQEGVLRTESVANPFVIEVEQRGLTARSFHSIIGLNTEIGECYEAVEHGNMIDYVNLREEIGDLYWYLAVLSDDLKLLLSDSGVNNENNSLLDSLKITRYLSNELLDISKKCMFYKKEINLQDELHSNYIQEIFNHLENLCSKLDTTKEKVWSINQEKLKARYPEKFSSDKAENRDLDKERKILEKN